MKKFWKRFLCVTLCALLLCGTAPLALPVGAADGYEAGDIIELGSYPQTRVDPTEYALINALSAQPQTWISYNYYYSESGVEQNTLDNRHPITSSDYMQYCDVTYDGQMYRGVKITGWRPFRNTYRQESRFSEQATNGYTTGNGIYWFRWEPLRWRVLNPRIGLVVTESVIDSQVFHNFSYKEEGNYVYEGQPAYWGDLDKTYYADNYEKSDIRAWLNDDFLHAAFTAAQQGAVTPTYLDNSSASYPAFSSAPTTDKVFLLTRTDVDNPAYFSGDQDRQAYGTDYAKCQGIYVSSDNDWASYWWTRTVTSMSDRILAVTSLSNYSNLGGYYPMYVDQTSTGVRPAVCLDFNAVRALQHEHSYTSSVTTPATCTADGVMTYTCACGETYTEPIPALGHDYNAVVTAPTCTADGFTTYTCTRCSDSYTADETPATGHTWNDGIVTTAATCTADGVMTYACACGETYTGTIPALGHDYDSVVTAPTCTAGGFTTYTCTRCGDSYVNAYTDALGHSFGDWFVTVEPTEDAQGEETRSCSRCGVQESRAVPKLPADDSAAFVVQGGKARAGETVQVTVSVRNNPGIVAAMLRLSYDPSILTLTGVRGGEIFAEEDFQSGGDLSAVPYGVSWLDALGSNHTQNGTLVTFTFRVADDAPAGETAVTIHYETKSTFSTDLQPIEFAVRNGVVEVVERMPGDADGDGSVTLRDAAVIRRYLVGGWNVSIVDMNCDVDADGSVDLIDVALILRYLSGGWGVVLR